MNTMLFALFLTSLVASGSLAGSYNSPGTPGTPETPAPGYTTEDNEYMLSINGTLTYEVNEYGTQGTLNTLDTLDTESPTQGTDSPTDSVTGDSSQSATDSPQQVRYCTCHTDAPNLVVNWQTPYTSSVCPYCNYSFEYPRGYSQVHVVYGYDRPVRQYFYQNGTLINSCSLSRVCNKYVTLNPDIPYVTIITGQTSNSNRNRRHGTFADSYPGRFMAAQGYHMMQHSYHHGDNHSHVCMHPPQLNSNRQHLESGCHYVYHLTTGHNVHVTMHFNRSVNVKLYAGHHLLLNHTGMHINTVVKSNHTHHQLHVTTQPGNHPVSAPTYHTATLNPNSVGNLLHDLTGNGASTGTGTHTGNNGGNNGGSNDDDNSDSSGDGGVSDASASGYNSGSSNTNDTRAVAIAGIVFGVIGFIMVSIGAAYLVHRRRREQSADLRAMLLPNDIVLNPVAVEA